MLFICLVGKNSGGYEKKYRLAIVTTQTINMTIADLQLPSTAP
jgi:hypothetical protein